MPCAVVVPVEAVHAVEFLAVVLVPLRVLARGEVGHDAAVGVVLRLLLHHPRLGEHHAAAAKVVFQMEMVVRRAVGEGDVAAIDEQPRQLAVLEKQVAAIVGGGDDGLQEDDRRHAPGLQHAGGVRHTQFRSVGPVDVCRAPAIWEDSLQGEVEPVVGEGHALVQVRRHVAVGVVEVEHTVDEIHTISLGWRL